MYSTFVETRPSAEIRRNSAVETAKRKIESAEEEEETRTPNQYKKSKSEPVNVAPHPVRILGRKYHLTKTAYKFIDVGILAQLPSHVEIIIGDWHGKEISLSPETWREIIDRKKTILSNLQTNAENARFPPPTLYVGALTLRFGKINNLSVLRIDSPKVRMAMSLSTLQTMFDLEHCINRVVATLSAVTRNVDARLTRFRDIASEVKDPVDAPRAIRDSGVYNQDDIIDCEIAALCF